MEPVLSTAQFLQTLWAGVESGYAEIRLIHKSGDYRKAKKMYRPMPVGEISEDGLQKLHKLNDEYHIYHRVGISQQPRSLKVDISTLTALWLEVDDPSEDAYQRLTKFWFYPNIILKSGGGYHAYWLFHRPLIIKDMRHVQEIERTIEGMMFEFGEGVDKKCKDVTRILRTPGFKNIKDRYGDEKPIAEVVWYDPTRYGYDLLHRHYALLGAPIQPKITRYIPKEAFSQTLPRWVQNWLQNPTLKGNGRNHTLYVMARAYNDAGMSISQAESDLIPAAQSLPGDHPLTRIECENSVKSAYKHPANPTAQLPRHMATFMAVEDTLMGGQ